MKIKAIVFDVDGTLTDGSINIGENGETYKKFNVKDGYGIHTIMPMHNMIPIIITGRRSTIVVKRCEELGITEIHQGVQEKTETLLNILKRNTIHLDEVAYIGDDLNDLDCMKIVGYSGCPSDSVIQVRETADYICNSAGGHGAVREFIDHIIEQYGL